MSARLYTLKTLKQKRDEHSKHQEEFINRMEHIVTERENRKFNRFILKWLVGMVAILFLIGFGMSFACGPEKPDTLIDQIKVGAL